MYIDLNLKSIPRIEMTIDEALNQIHNLTQAIIHARCANSYGTFKTAAINETEVTHQSRETYVAKLDATVTGAAPCAIVYVVTK